MSKMRENIIKNKLNLILFFVGLFLIACICVLADQITKMLAMKYLEVGKTTNFLGDTLLVFQLTYNKGAAWGLGGDNAFSRIILIIISWAVALGIPAYFVYILLKKKNEFKPGLFLILTFVEGGDIGNLIDRTFFYDRGVVDFLSICKWWKNFGIFNVADSILVVSIFALLIYLIYEYYLESKKIKKEREEAEKVQKEESDNK